MKSVSLGVKYFSTTTTDTATTTASAINPGTTPTSFITAANAAANAAAAATDTSIRVTKTEFLLKTSIQYKADK